MPEQSIAPDTSSFLIESVAESVKLGMRVQCARSHITDQTKLGICAGDWARYTTLETHCAKVYWTQYWLMAALERAAT